MSEKRLELVRGLGAWASMAIVVGTMIGTGIFLKPAEMAREGRSVSIVFAAWIVGGVLSLFGALSFAELGAAIPEAGGEYAYLRRGLGAAWGFLSGWMRWIVGWPSSQSSSAAGMMRFMGFFIPAVATPIFTWHIAIPGLTGWLKPYDFVFTWAQPLGVFWLVLMTGVNYLGVRLGGGVQVFLTAIKLFGVLMVIGVAFALPASGAHMPGPIWPLAGSTGLFGAFLVTLAMVISALGSMNSSVLSGARVPYAMARDGIFFKIADGIHPKYRTPGRALIFQCVLASLMALTGTFEELTNLFIFAGWIFYGLAVVALFRLRRTEPDMPRPYRCWGYPWVPGLFVFGALALTLNIWLERPGRSSIGLLLMVAGLPGYRDWG